MKTSLTKLSSSFVLLTLSFGALAKPIARITEMSGTVFVVKPDGSTAAVKKGQDIEEKAEVMVEEGGTATLTDFYDSTYHLTGGAHLKLFNKSVQLKNGKTWIQGLGTKHQLAVTTANGLASFNKAEFIATFDQATSRTQVLVVQGDVDISNVLDKNMKYTVSAGTFSMVDPEVENGVPRAPTKVGLQSLNAALAEFKKLPEAIKAPERKIASVEEASQASQPAKKGEIIFITSTRMPASVAPSVAGKYLKKLKAKKTPTPIPVPIRFYGTSFSKTEPAAVPRMPASLKQEALPLPKKVEAPVLSDVEFSQSLKKHEEEQPKHRKELQNLIDDLKSY